MGPSYRQIPDLKDRGFLWLGQCCRLRRSACFVYVFTLDRPQFICTRMLNMENAQSINSYIYAVYIPMGLSYLQISYDPNLKARGESVAQSMLPNTSIRLFCIPSGCARTLQIISAPILSYKKHPISQDASFMGHIILWDLHMSRNLMTQDLKPRWAVWLYQCCRIH